MPKKYRNAKAADEIESSLERQWSNKYTITNPYKIEGPHKDFLEHILSDDTYVSIVNGPAGSAKTFIAVLAGLLCIKKNIVEEIVYIRSVVESASSKLGHLPGTVEDKFQPWSIPFYDKVEELLDPGETKHIMRAKIVRCIPVNLSRGLTFRNSLVIVDECQNMTVSELETVLTRFGKGSSYVLLGDCTQSDIGNRSGFKDVFNAFNTEASNDVGIGSFTFDASQIVRHPILAHICEVLTSIKNT